MEVQIAKETLVPVEKLDLEIMGMDNTSSIT